MDEVTGVWHRYEPRRVAWMQLVLGLFMLPAQIGLLIFIGYQRLGSWLIIIYACNVVVFAGMVFSGLLGLSAALRLDGDAVQFVSLTRRRTVDFGDVRSVEHTTSDIRLHLTSGDTARIRGFGRGWSWASQTPAVRRNLEMVDAIRARTSPAPGDRVPD